MAFAHSSLRGEAENFEKIRVPYALCPDYSGFSARTIWDDSRICVRHLIVYEKIAVVSSANYISRAVRFFSFNIQCSINIFSNNWLERHERGMDEQVI